MNRLACLSILGVALVAASCAPPAERPPPNFVLIVVDTLRRDHVGCYGAERPTSPAIDALAASGVRFDRAYSAAPWTQPAVASMLTGLYPSSHGLTSVSSLPAELATLPERLHGAGYATEGVAASMLLASNFGFDRGFDRYHHEFSGSPRDDVSTERVTDRAIAAIDRLSAGDAPFFLFVHYFDPHYNYLPHAEVAFAPPRAGRLTGDEPIQRLRALGPTLTPTELGFIRALYDEEIRHTDGGIGRLLDHLAEAGLDDDTWIVLTADHGEEFQTHGWIGHTRSLYEELIHVPLIVRPPGGVAGRVVEQVVSTASLAATITGLAGLDVSAGTFQAPPLGALLAPESAEGPGAAFAEVDFVPIQEGNEVKRAHKKAIVTERYKLIRDDDTGRFELYDVIADPAELRELSGREPAVVGRMRPLLEQAIGVSRGRTTEAPGTILTQPEIEMLRSLGYVGG